MLVVPFCMNVHKADNLFFLALLYLVMYTLVFLIYFFYTDLFEVQCCICMFNYSGNKNTEHKKSFFFFFFVRRGDIGRMLDSGKVSAPFL